MLFSFYSMKLYIAILEVIIEIHNHYDKINSHLGMLAYCITYGSYQYISNSNN